METTSSRVGNGRAQTTIRSAIRSPWEIMVQSASRAVRRLVPERWLIDLLVLALVAFLIGASALYGLAVVSTRTASSPQPSAGRFICGVREAGPDAFDDVCGDRLCCEERP
jgi:hypothetical protein